MNLQNKTLFAFALAGILVVGSLPLLTTDAFAQARGQDDVNEPIFAGQDDSLVVFFESLDDCIGTQSENFVVIFDDSNAVNGPVFPANPNPTITSTGLNQAGNANIWEIYMPNIVDNFNTKLMRIQVTSCDFGAGQASIIDVNAENLGLSAQIEFIEHVDDIADTPGAFYFYEDYEIHPNPDFEIIFLSVPLGSALIQVVVDTISFDEDVVGGEIIPIDATSLILASAQTFSWMIPVVLSGIGIGLFVVSRKSENF